MEQELDASDIRACGGFLPLGRTGLASGTLADTAAGATASRTGTPTPPVADCRETSESADPSAAWGGTSPAMRGESFTNEPELHEDVILSQDQEGVEVAADSGVDSGLDKVADLLGAGGREHEADVEYPEFDEEVLVGDEPTGDDGRRLGAGQTTRSVGEAVPTRSVATRTLENPRSGGAGLRERRRGNR